MSIVLAVLSLSLSENLGRRVAEAVAGFLPISESFVQFGLTQYMPRLRQALEQMGVGPRLGTRLALLSQLLGVFVRIVSANSCVQFGCYFTQKSSNLVACLCIAVVCILLARRNF